MTNTSPGNNDTLGLQGVTSGNAIYGAISDASGATGNDLNGGGGYTRIIDSDYTGTWILASSANSYSGGTYIGYQNNTPANGGTLQVGTGQAGQDGNLGNTSQVLFNSTNTALSGSGGALIFDIVGSQTALYPIWGNGSVTKLGGGIQVLAGTNSYTGATTISAGTLQLGTGQSGQDGTLAGINNGAYGSTLLVADSGALVFDIVGSQTALYPISGPGALIMIGPGELVLSSTDNSYGGYSGGTIVEGGTVTVTNNEEIADGSSLTVGNPSLIAEFAPLMPAAADRSGDGASDGRAGARRRGAGCRGRAAVGALPRSAAGDDGTGPRKDRTGVINRSREQLRGGPSHGKTRVYSRGTARSNCHHRHPHRTAPSRDQCCPRGRPPRHSA